jgi:hypothetical protein
MVDAYRSMRDDGNQESDDACQDKRAAKTHEQQKARWVSPDESDALDD